MSAAIGRLNDALAGRYSVERQLGEGGMATVYLARDVRHDRRVALKVLKPELAAVVGAERFLTEIRTTANLQHPHILPLFDSGQADGMLFYVMPYVEGESLRERLDRERQLPVDEAVRIATNVAEALDYAHAQGVIHRDIKPANILLQAGKPVVSDFGIALAVSAGGGGRLTETGLSLGTPHYMSPEQATGDSRVGRATDVWALGCVLYEMLVGEPPYTGGTPQAILGKIIAGEGVSATKLRSTVPPHVDAVVRKALEKVPADRFGSADEFARALADRGYQNGVRATAGAGRGALWRSAALLIVGGVLGFALTTIRGDADEERAATVMRFALPTIGVDSLQTGSTLLQDVAISPDGTVIAYLGRNEDGSTFQIHLRRIDELEGTPLRGTEGGIAPFFSPGGEWVGFVDAAEPRTIRRVPLQGGGPETIATLPATVTYVAGTHWATDDQIFVGTGQGTGLFLVSVARGTSELLVEGQYHWPYVIPGRDAVLMMDHATELALVALDSRSGEVKSLGIAGTGPRYLPTGHLVYADAEGGLWAAPFDVESLEITSSPVRIVDGIEVKASNEGAADFSLSDDGHLVYVVRTAAPVRTTLATVGPAGERTVVSELDGIAWYPRFSPDGGRVAFALTGNFNAGSDADLWVIDLARGALTRVTFDGNRRFFPLWSRDGQTLIHSSGPGLGNAVLSVTADGSGVADTLLPATGGRQFATSWSPDGSVIAYHVGPQGTPTTSRDLWIWRLDQPEPRGEPFVATPAEEAGAIFSPDGSWVAYVSNKSGQSEVYARPFPGPGPEVTLSVGGGSEPAWSPSGLQLYYRRESDMMSVSVDPTSPSLAASAPRRLFADPYLLDPAGNGIANYDVSPDAERMILVEEVVREASSEPETHRLRITLNFYEEVRTRIPN
jgi:tRNA A-37 threonylcarbamoyl transferase component Bud32